MAEKRQVGRPVSKPGRTMRRVAIEDELWEQAGEAAAAGERKTRSDIINAALREKFARDARRGGK